MQQGIFLLALTPFLPTSASGTLPLNPEGQLRSTLLHISFLLSLSSDTPGLFGCWKLGNSSPHSRIKRSPPWLCGDAIGCSQVPTSTCIMKYLHIALHISHILYLTGRHVYYSATLLLYTAKRLRNSYKTESTETCTDAIIIGLILNMCWLNLLIRDP